MSQAWKQCSSCKKDIGYGATYYKCSVSTCNRQRTALFFCSVECWQAHVPGARHRDAWAEPEQAPRSAAETAPAPEPARMAPTARRVVSSPAVQATAEPPVGQTSRDVLVVVSKLKKYIKDRSSMNTSDNVVSILSDHLRTLANEAIRNAARDGRKTVLDRDFVPLIER